MLVFVEHRPLRANLRCTSDRPRLSGRSLRSAVFGLRRPKAIISTGLIIHGGNIEGAPRFVGQSAEDEPCPGTGSLGGYGGRRAGASSTLGELRPSYPRFVDSTDSGFGLPQGRNREERGRRFALQDVDCDRPAVSRSSRKSAASPTADRSLRWFVDTAGSSLAVCGEWASGRARDCVPTPVTTIEKAIDPTTTDGLGATTTLPGCDCGCDRMVMIQSDAAAANWRQRSHWLHPP